MSTATAPSDTAAPEIADIGYGRVFAGFYDRLFPEDGAAARTAAALASWHPGGPALELGVGTGRIAVPLARLTGEVVGVDSSPEMLEQLRSATGPQDAVTPVHGDIRTHDDGTRYGLVYCVCGTLSLVLDPADQRAAITRAARSLAPGGTLVVETHNPGFVRTLHEGLSRTSFFVPYPEPGTGLQTYSTLLLEQNLWHTSHLLHEPGGTRIGSEITRLTTPEDVDAYATGAGLERTGLYGDWSGGPFVPERSPVHISRFTHAAGRTEQP
ncbi:class I SAM-dependent methyltransferase [Streptomyces nitrosporeus]|uniref:Class I SAM-dependent methyltransferase n=1 Tax=Streptomyces nitrosporeus TaxID=28894 RepID=A0A5J6F3R5_9ACTN|nr:class I SAM-dependent methyltransferase [Streptomyces nitrosporeus]QEU70969.1 class I SAM-dependent methyltransferase [Streptomyces nitrosporeus]GGZ22990.1 methyltransferase [Streptomyces nitrosporeus]